MKLSIAALLLLLTLSLGYSAEDAQWSARFTEKGSAEAYRYYAAEYQQKPDFENAWKFARAARFHGDRYASVSSEKKRLFLEAMDAASNAVRLAPSQPEGWFFLASTIGPLALVSDPASALTAPGRIVDAASHGIAIAPAFREGAFYLVRGRTYQKAPGFPISIGDKAKAEADYRAALTFSTSNRMLYLFYAELLLETGRKQDAFRMANRGLALPFSGQDHSGDSDIVSKLRGILEKS